MGSGFDQFFLSFLCKPRSMPILPPPHRHDINSILATNISPLANRWQREGFSEHIGPTPAPLQVCVFRAVGPRPRACRQNHPLHVQEGVFPDKPSSPASPCLVVFEPNGWFGGSGVASHLATRTSNSMPYANHLEAEHLRSSFRGDFNSPHG